MLKGVKIKDVVAYKSIAQIYIAHTDHLTIEAINEFKAKQGVNAGRTYYRWNTDTDTLEFYQPTGWKQLAKQPTNYPTHMLNMEGIIMEAEYQLYVGTVFNRKIGDILINQKAFCSKLPLAEAKQEFIHLYMKEITDNFDELTIAVHIINA